MAEIDPRVKNICKIGQGHDCCRYLVMGDRGFECARLSPRTRAVIDARVTQFTAQGDNCEGKELTP